MVLGKAFVIQDERHTCAGTEFSNSAAKDAINSQLMFLGVLVELGLRQLTRLELFHLDVWRHRGGVVPAMPANPVKTFLSHELFLSTQ